MEYSRAPAAGRSTGGRWGTGSVVSIPRRLSDEPHVAVRALWAGLHLHDALHFEAVHPAQQGGVQLARLEDQLVQAVRGDGNARRSPRTRWASPLPESRRRIIARQRGHSAHDRALELLPARPADRRPVGVQLAAVGHSSPTAAVARPFCAAGAVALGAAEAASGCRRAERRPTPAAAAEPAAPGPAGQARVTGARLPAVEAGDPCWRDRGWRRRRGLVLEGGPGGGPFQRRGEPEQARWRTQKPSQKRQASRETPRHRGILDVGQGYVAARALRRADHRVVRHGPGARRRALRGNLVREPADDWGLRR